MGSKLIEVAFRATSNHSLSLVEAGAGLRTRTASIRTLHADFSRGKMANVLEHCIILNVNE